VTNNSVHKKVYEYDTCKRTWRTLNDLPSNIGSHSVAQVGSDIYFGGGTPVTFDRNNSVTKKWNKYSPFTTNGTTLPLTDMPFPIYAHRSVSIDGLVYVMGDG
jgi:N-acetylneuraminic acid mutarotase